MLTRVVVSLRCSGSTLGEDPLMAPEREVLGVPDLVVSKFAIRTLNSPFEPGMDTQSCDFP